MINVDIASGTSYSLRTGIYHYFHYGKSTNYTWAMASIANCSFARGYIIK